MCPNCQSAEDTALHIFIGCPFVVRCWFELIPSFQPGVCIKAPLQRFSNLGRVANHGRKRRAIFQGGSRTPCHMWSYGIFGLLGTWRYSKTKSLLLENFVTSHGASPLKHYLPNSTAELTSVISALRKGVSLETFEVELTALSLLQINPPEKTQAGRFGSKK